jgi:hypothetical protein
MTTDAFHWRPQDNLHPLDPKLSTQVQATLRADALTAKAWARAAKIAKVLFDPALVPDLAERADTAEAEFYARCGEFGDLHADTHDTEYNPHVAHEQGVTRVWPVGTVYVHLFPDDDATEDMAALGALATPKPTYIGNVVPLHGASN